MDISSTIWALKVIGIIAPIATYFLVLGVINSQARPRLVSGRWDFIVLTGIFAPALFWPIGSLYSLLGPQAILLLLLAGGLALRVVLPHPWKQWVIYNTDADRAGQAVHAALERLGWDWQQSDDPRTFEVPDRRVRIEIGGLALLNAVNVQIHTDAQDPREVDIDALIGEVEGVLGSYQLLPGAAGLCLVLVGSGLMIVPMWLMTRHMGHIVEAIQQLFFA